MPGLLDFFLLPVVGSDLVDVVVEPVGEEQTGMGPPAYHRISGGVIVREIVFWDCCVQALCAVPLIFILQGKWIVLQVSGDKDLPIVFREHDI